MDSLSRVDSLAFSEAVLRLEPGGICAVQLNASSRVWANACEPTYLCPWIGRTHPWIAIHLSQDTSVVLGIPRLGLRYSRGGSRTTAVSQVLRLTLCGPSCRGGHLHLCEQLRWAASLVWAASHCSSSPTLRLCGQHRLGEQIRVYPPADVSVLSLGVPVWYSPVWAVITRLIQVWAVSR